MAEGPDGYFLHTHRVIPRPPKPAKPVVLDPNAQMTPQHKEAIKEGFEQGLTWAMDYKEGRMDSMADREMQRILRAKIEVILGDEKTPRTNAEVKGLLLQGLGGSQNPASSMPGATAEVTSKAYKHIASAAFKVSFSRALEIYAEKVEGRTGQAR